MMYMDHSKVKRQSHDSHTMIPTLVGLYNVFTCTGSSNETAFSSGDLMGGVAPGRSARGSISREAWTEVRERAECVGRHGRREQDEFTSDTPTPACTSHIRCNQWNTPISTMAHPCSTLPHPLFHYAIPYTTPLVPLCHTLHHTPCSTMPYLTPHPLFHYATAYTTPLVPLCVNERYHMHQWLAQYLEMQCMKCYIARTRWLTTWAVDIFQKIYKQILHGLAHACSTKPPNIATK